MLYLIVTLIGGVTPLYITSINKSTYKEEIYLLANRASFATYNKARSSALVVNIITIFYLFAL